ncbi:MAG: hypothetical protein ACO3IN_13555 [Steroidobacteraceae bacterium]
MSREVCGKCWTPYDDGYKCACPTPALDEAPYTWKAVDSSIWRHKGSEAYGPLYTRPQPRREWRGLTDEEIRDLWSWSATVEAERTATTQQHAFARAVEANLKEKNT